MNQSSLRQSPGGSTALWWNCNSRCVLVYVPSFSVCVAAGKKKTSVAIADGYAQQSDWDPRDAGDGYLYVVLRPQRIQAWTEVHELPGRTIMRNGRWSF
jgi:hypothetical protein